MSIVIIVLIIVSIIIAAFGFLVIFNLGGSDDKPKQSDVFATNAFLLAIFFLLLAIAIRIF